LAPAELAESELGRQEGRDVSEQTLHGSAELSVRLHLKEDSVCLSVCLSICLSVCPSVGLSFGLLDVMPKKKSKKEIERKTKEKLFQSVERLQSVRKKNSNRIEKENINKIFTFLLLCCEVC
jgi:hypothetical protein